MGQVLNLSDFRKREKTPKGDAPTPEAGPAYYCMRCDTDWFKLFPSGMVQCANCGAAIRNILVADSADSPRQGRET